MQTTSNLMDKLLKKKKKLNELKYRLFVVAFNMA